MIASTLRDHPVAGRQPGPQPGAELADQPGAHHQPVRDRLGVGGVLAQGGQEVGWRGGSPGGQPTEGHTIAVGREADHPDPLPERGGDAAQGPGRASRASSTGFDAVEWLVIDDGSTDRTVEVARAARRRPRRPADQQQGPRGRLPGRARRGPEAGRGRDRQHRRRRPVPGRGHPEAGRADPRRARRHGRRRPAGRARSSTSRRPRRRCSGSAAGSCAAPPGPTSPTRPRAFAPTTARRRCSSSSSPTSPTRSRA